MYENSVHIIIYTLPKKQPYIYIYIYQSQVYFTNVSSPYNKDFIWPIRLWLEEKEKKVKKEGKKPDSMLWTNLICCSLFIRVSCINLKIQKAHGARKHPYNTSEHFSLFKKKKKKKQHASFTGLFVHYSAKSVSSTQWWARRVWCTCKHFNIIIP